MSADCSLTHRQIALPARDGRPAARPSLLQHIGTWYDRWLQRRQLEELTQEALADVGLAPAQARAEAAKPFWRA